MRRAAYDPFAPAPRSDGFDDAVESAYDPSAHERDDVAAVLEALDGVRVGPVPDALEGVVARAWLDAAAAVREAAGRVVLEVVAGVVAAGDGFAREHAEELIVAARMDGRWRD